MAHITLLLLAALLEVVFGMEKYPMHETRLIANICGDGKMPRGWRIASQDVDFEKKARKKGWSKSEMPSFRGLADLNISVSGQHCMDKRGRQLYRFFEKLVRRRKNTYLEKGDYARANSTLLSPKGIDFQVASKNSSSLPNLKAAHLPHSLEKDLLGLHSGGSRGGGNFDKIIVLDARLEAHGFLDKLAVSWHQRFNNWERIDMPLDQLDRDEEAKLNELRRDHEVTVCDKPSPEFGAFPGERQIRYKKVYSERELWERVPYVHYFRLHQPDHCPPPDEQVDQFLHLIDSIYQPGATWIHVHCKGGAGRSTAVASFVDMIFNAHKASFHDIMARQQILGKSDLLNQHADSTNPEKDQCYKERVNFLHQFHRFCKLRLQHKSNVTWTAYLSQKDSVFN